MKGDREIDYRNATSRAYYSAFLGCRDLAGDPQRSSKDEGSHDACINHYIENRNGQDDNDRIYMRVGYKLRKIKAERVRADYKTKEDFTKADATQTFSYVDEIFELLNQISGIDKSEQG